MASTSFLCSPKCLFLFLCLTAVPLSLLVSLDTRASRAAYSYHSRGWMRECAKWDDLHRRFLVSFMEGGVGQITLPDDSPGGSNLDEIVVVKDADLAGNASLGISVDRPRNRLLVVVADVLRNRYSGVAAYDLDSWKRLFLTHLSGSPGVEKTFADDVAVDKNGNSYITDAKGGKIWKVSVEGKLLSTITSPLFQAQEWYGGLISLNGIVYHPDGYLLVIHTMTGLLYKIEGLEDEEGKEVVKVVEGVKLRFGDGIELVSRTRLVVAASHPSARLVESTNGWESARVVGQFVGPTYRIATAATVKEGRIFLSHIFGFGYPKKKHMLVEAVFSSS
ncbi:hypothetical protein V2J09_000620 [Rumex salicifolius]